MFFVFNKQKIYTYLLSIVAVILLFCIASGSYVEKDVLTSSNTTNRLLPIYGVNTTDNNVALTMNCAW